MQRTGVILFTFSPYCASKTSARNASLLFSPSRNPFSLPGVIAKTSPLSADASWSSFCPNYKSVLPTSIPSLAQFIPPNTSKGEESAVTWAQQCSLPRILASFSASQGLLLGAELLGYRRLCLPQQFKPILRVKEGWGQRLCVGGFLLCRWVPGGPGHSKSQWSSLCL